MNACNFKRTESVRSKRFYLTRLNDGIPTKHLLNITELYVY